MEEVNDKILEVGGKMVYQVFVEMRDVYSKDFEADTEEDARIAAECEAWTEENGWKSTGEGSSEIIAVDFTSQ